MEQSCNNEVLRGAMRLGDGQDEWLIKVRASKIETTRDCASTTDGVTLIGI